MMSICVILYLSTSYILLIFVLMIRLPPRSTRTDTLFPYTTLFRSIVAHPISPLGASIVNGALNSFRDKNLTPAQLAHQRTIRSEEHTSELQSLMRISYAVFCLKKKKKKNNNIYKHNNISKTNRHDIQHNTNIHNTIRHRYMKT